MMNASTFWYVGLLMAIIEGVCLIRFANNDKVLYPLAIAEVITIGTLLLL